MNQQDWKGAFGEASPAFERRVLQTLDRLKIEEERPVKRKLSVSLVAAVVLCALLSGLAIAAQNWGLTDVIRDYFYYGSAPMPTGAVDAMIQQIGAEARSEHCTFRVSEAIYDGQYTHMILDAQPEPGAMIVRWRTQLEDPVSDLGGALENEQGTVEEYARANGFQRVYRLQPVDWSGVYDMLDNYECKAGPGGALSNELTGMVKVTDQRQQLDLRLRCMLEPLMGGGAPETAMLNFALTASPKLGPVKAEGPVDFDAIGVRLDGLSVTSSPLCMEVWMRYTIADRAKWEAVGCPGLTVRNEAGGQYETSSVTRMGMDGAPELLLNHHFETRITIEPVETLPDRINVGWSTDVDGAGERVFEGEMLALQ